MSYYLYLKALHVVAVVCWFAGLFYLPRLFVYHALSHDQTSQGRFVLMERKLYRGIMWPSMIATWILGLWMLYEVWPVYGHAWWLHVKLTLVVLLTLYHLQSGYYRKKIAQNPHYHTDRFWRIYNELPVFILIAVCILVIVKPS